MIVILEGPDCAGKTTLARNAFHDFGYLHYGPPKKDAWDEYMERVEELDDQTLDAPGNNVVIDRFMYGEPIYSRIMRRPSSFYPYHCRMIERVLMTMEVSVVLCLPPWETVKGLWEERLDEELIKKEADMRRVYDSYVELGDRIQLPLIKYDLTKDDPKKAVQWAMKLKTQPNKGPGIGMWHEGAILMVGERPNPNTTTRGWPFIDNGGSSVWLAQKMDEWDIDESNLYWVNAFGSSGFETPGQFIADLKPSRIIALGNTAKLWCQRHATGYDVADIPHPAWWKRFQVGKEYPLLEALS